MKDKLCSGLTRPTEIWIPTFRPGRHFSRKIVSSSNISISSETWPWRTRVTPPSSWRSMLKLKLINFQFIYLNVTRNSLTHINENQKLDLKSCCIDIVHLQFYMYTIRSNQINTKNLNDFLFLLEKEKLIKSQSCRHFQIWFWKITPEYYKFSTFFRNRFWILFCYQTTGRLLDS